MNWQGNEPPLVTFHCISIGSETWTVLLQKKNECFRHFLISLAHTVHICTFAFKLYSTFYSICCLNSAVLIKQLINNWTTDFPLFCRHKLPADWKTLQVLQWGPLCICVCRWIGVWMFVFDQFWMEESEHVL